MPICRAVASTRLTWFGVEEISLAVEQQQRAQDIFAHHQRHGQHAAVSRGFVRRAVTSARRRRRYPPAGSLAAARHPAGDFVLQVQRPALVLGLAYQHPSPARKGFWLPCSRMIRLSCDPRDSLITARVRFEHQAHIQAGRQLAR